MSSLDRQRSLLSEITAEAASRLGAIEEARKAASSTNPAKDVPRPESPLTTSASDAARDQDEIYSSSDRFLDAAIRVQEKRAERVRKTSAAAMPLPSPSAALAAHLAAARRAVLETKKPAAADAPPSPESLPLGELDVRIEKMAEQLNEKFSMCEQALCSLPYRTEVAVLGSSGELKFGARGSRWGLYFVCKPSNDIRDVSQMSIDQRLEAFELVPKLLEVLRQRRIERHRKMQLVLEAGDKALRIVASEITGGD
jgi:hypothetical protein